MEQKKILIVDDEQDLCEILLYNLTMAGYHAEVAHSGEDAWNLMHQAQCIMYQGVRPRDIRIRYTRTRSIVTCANWMHMVPCKFR